MAGFSLFGLDALPFKIVIFATQFANLVAGGVHRYPAQRMASPPDSPRRFCGS